MSATVTASSWQRKWKRGPGIRYDKIMQVVGTAQRHRDTILIQHLPWQTMPQSQGQVKASKRPNKKKHKFATPTACSKQGCRLATEYRGSKSVSLSSPGWSSAASLVSLASSSFLSSSPSTSSAWWSNACRYAEGTCSSSCSLQPAEIPSDLFTTVTERSGRLARGTQFPMLACQVSRLGRVACGARLRPRMRFCCLLVHRDCCQVPYGRGMILQPWVPAINFPGCNFRFLRKTNISTRFHITLQVALRSGTSQHWVDTPSRCSNAPPRGFQSQSEARVLESGGKLLCGWGVAGVHRGFLWHLLTFIMAKMPKAGDHGRATT